MFSFLFDLLPFDFALFVCLLVFYHGTEFLVSFYFNRAETDSGSLLLSKEYFAAMTLATTEYWIERWLFPSMKASEGFALAITLVGFVVAAGGDLFRKYAMIHAGKAFSHRIREKRVPGHHLVVDGPYAFCRHPGYLGWWVWSVGTQIMLKNPISTPLFYVAAQSFFADRIPFEENLLINLFPDKYPAYRAATPTRMPGIH